MNLQVGADMKWGDVRNAFAFAFPPGSKRCPYVLKKHYLSLLYHYEQVYFLKPGNPASITQGGASSNSINTWNISNG